MTRNLAGWDRALRLAAATLAGAAAFVAPLPLAVRIGALAVTAVYLGFTALTGTCAGYRLLGLSSCPRTLRR